MSIAIVTGSAGLIGAEAVRHFSQMGYKVVGIDNNMRQEFFGAEASTEWSRRNLCNTITDYSHFSIDIRDQAAVETLFRQFGSEIKVVIHTAAQPSHDWAARAPHVDFSVNATGTLTLLEATRQFCPKACFVFTSTNKVYGDNPNSLPLEEKATRWEIAESHPYFQHGIDEHFSVDHTKHSLFGASKLAADVLVQEYGRYFGMNTVVFRGGCLTGPGHSGTQLHGFLSYLVKCSITDTPYTIFGYKGKQVRDNIHSYDLVNMFWNYVQDPRPGEVYNAGGGRHSNCSMQEAITLCEKINGRPMSISYKDENRIGDHIWWVSDTRKFQNHFPAWKQKYGVEEILREVFTSMRSRLETPATKAA